MPRVPAHPCRPSARLFAALALAGAALISAAPAHAQASLSFSGGNGTPLTISLAAPVTYTIDTTSQHPIIVFDALSAGSDRFNFTSLSGTITFSVNGGAARALEFINDGWTQNGITADDVYLYQIIGLDVQAGDLITLSAGKLTTSSAIALAPPADGVYTTFVAGSDCIRISGNGVSAAAVPEPGSAALAALPLLAGVGALVTTRARGRRCAQSRLRDA